uniref:Leucine zipper protein 2 n=1 Tax=Pseudonaja textilis TaxID=8673 RepID=A0A670Y5I7_PSETE
MCVKKIYSVINCCYRSCANNSKVFLETESFHFHCHTGKKSFLESHKKLTLFYCLISLPRASFTINSSNLHFQINFLKTEMERKSKMIRDLQNENKSLKNKLLSGNKLCGIHAEESKKIQAQLKELRYGKKDLIFKAQQLTDLEQKLAIAKEELEKAALDKESQLKALKETVQLCLSSVLHNQSPTTNIIPSRSIERQTSSFTNGSKAPFQVTNTKVSGFAFLMEVLHYYLVWVMKHLQKNNQAQRLPRTPHFNPELQKFSFILIF